MNIKLSVISTSLLSILLLACSQGADSPRGFSLPEGDIDKGEIAFKKYQCLACHSLEGYTDDSLVKVREDSIVLGGRSPAVTTYAQLVTSVINPSHEIVEQKGLKESVTNEDGSSKMRKYNDVMTITELTNIVAFLQPKYSIEPPRYTQYRRY
ncbi:cytochrome C [Pseudocolwellia sp. HL-MZ7]|uniref:cytochrome C n=1 Tax=Pseudocolwellia sp. HL-MZ7 TaxID=3400627 RepID=UPI003CF2C161